MGKYSNTPTETTTVGAAILLASKAIDVAMEFGTAQTSDIICLRQENKELKEEIAVIRKDRGVSPDYPSPEEFEEIKTQWSLEMTALEAKVEMMKKRRVDKMMPITYENTVYQEEADEQNEKSRRLRKELGELQTENIKLKEDNAEHEGLIDGLRSALDDEKSQNAILRHSIEEERKKRTLLMENAESQKEAYKNANDDKLERELELSQIEIQKLKDQREPGQSHHKEQENKLRDKIAALEEAGKRRTENIEFLLKRVAELEPQGGLPLSSRYGLASKD